MKTISKINHTEDTLKMNQLALKATEKVFLKAIDTAENLQELTSKRLKSSFNFAAKQQDRFFNNLEKRKEMIWANLNKTLDFFSKN
jgi:putative lipase involved disintegration of autophagic bodies